MRDSFLLSSCIVLLATIVLAPALYGGFFFDDIANIVQNSSIQINALTVEALKSSLEGPQAGPLGRTVSVMSFAINYYFFGLDAFYFKLINLIIHLINGLLVAYLVFLILDFYKQSLSANTVRWIAFYVSALWLIHPINIIPVMLVVQRMTLLSGLFVLLGLVSYLKAIQAPKFSHYIAWMCLTYLVFWPLALLSKETGILLPLYALVLTWWIKIESPQRVIRKSSWYITLGIVIYLMANAAYLLLFNWSWVEAGYATRSFSLSERLMTQARVLWFYFSQIIFPNYRLFGLYLDDFILSTSLFIPIATFWAIFGWSVVLILVITLARRIPLIIFIFGWFLIGHLLESTFLPLEIAHEYRNYMPSVGVIMGVVLVSARYFRVCKERYRSLIKVLAFVVLLMMAFLSHLRALDLGNPLVGLQMEAAKHPNSARANYAAALALINAGRGHATQEPETGKLVKHYFEQASQADPVFKLGLLGLVTWACASDIPVQSQWVNTLAERLQQTAFTPGDSSLPKDIAEVVWGMPRCLNYQQVTILFTAGGNNPRSRNTVRADFWEYLGDYELIVQGNAEQAVRYYERALSLALYDATLTNKLNGLKRIPNKH